MTDHPTPPFKAQPQDFPALTAQMDPKPDHGEKTYKGSGRLTGKKAIITGGDSGIGRAVAIAYAREGADVLIAYLDKEEQDAQETKKWIEEAGSKAVLVQTDISKRELCEELVNIAMKELGGIDILVNNAAYQTYAETLDDVTIEEWEKTFQTNVHGMFYLCKAAVPQMKKGSSIINTSSVNAKNPMPILLAYGTTKGAIANFTIGLSQMLAEQGIRVNAVLPGPVWTPFIPTGLPPEQMKTFGSDVPFKRPGQPAELAGAYVLLASNEGSYMSGSLVTVAGGMPIF